MSSYRQCKWYLCYKPIKQQLILCDRPRKVIKDLINVSLRVSVQNWTWNKNMPNTQEASLYTKKPKVGQEREIMLMLMTMIMWNVRWNIMMRATRKKLKNLQQERVLNDDCMEWMLGWMDGWGSWWWWCWYLKSERFLKLNVLAFIIMLRIVFVIVSFRQHYVSDFLCGDN